MIRHVQEGIGVCFPNPPQTPPIQRSSLAVLNLCNQFSSTMTLLPIPGPSQKAREPPVRPPGTSFQQASVPFPFLQANHDQGNSF